MDDLSGLNEQVEVAHEFEVDLNCLVLANLRIAMDGIGHAEDEELAGIDEGFTSDEWEVEQAVSSHASQFYGELRNAALCLAMVALVTRLQHWTGCFTKGSNPVRAKGKSKVKGAKLAKKSNSQLINQLRALDQSLGAGPVSITSFEKLVNVRDSVIHHDSKARWNYGREEKTVDSSYCNPAFDVSNDEDLLRQAADNATKQVKWYDERLHRDASKRVH